MDGTEPKRSRSDILLTLAACLAWLPVLALALARFLATREILLLIMNLKAYLLLHLFAASVSLVGLASLPLVDTRRRKASYVIALALPLAFAVCTFLGVLAWQAVARNLR